MIPSTTASAIAAKKIARRSGDIPRRKIRIDSTPGKALIRRRRRTRLIRSGMLEAVPTQDQNTMQLYGLSCIQRPGRTVLTERFRLFDYRTFFYRFEHSRPQP